MTTSSQPKGWGHRRLRFDAHINPPKSELSLPDDTEVSFVPMEAVGEFGSLNLDQVRPINEVYTGYTYFAEGDLCIAKITPCFENGKGALATNLTNGVGFGTTELHVIRTTGTLDARFLYYISIAHDFRGFGASEMLGAGGQKRVPEAFIKNWRAPLPRIETQQRIAAFLDKKTAQIDALIAKKQALLDRLAEKRQAIITQAVTKGLNPTAPMKDSGINWLGQIPAHWKLLPLRRVASQVVTGPTPPSAAGDFFTDGEVPWFTPGDFSGDILLGSTEKRLTRDAFQEGHAVLYPPDSVLLVGIGATLGKVGLATMECSSNQQINAITVLPENDPVFLAYFLHGFRAEVRISASGNTLPILNQDKTKMQIVTCPPLKEQSLIGAYLRKSDQKIDCVEIRIRESISLLGERRSAVITQAVTGKTEIS